VGLRRHPERRDAIRGAAVGLTHVDPHVAGQLFARLSSEALPPATTTVASLSAREREVLVLLGEGASNAAIVLSAVKFLAVILYFMHLRWDKVFCTILFFIGLVLGGGTLAALVVLFRMKDSIPPSFLP